MNGVSVISAITLMGRRERKTPPVNPELRTGISSILMVWSYSTISRRGKGRRRGLNDREYDDDDDNDSVMMRMSTFMHCIVM